MKNIAKFEIIGNLGKLNPREKVAYASIASERNYKDAGEWKTITSWNDVTFFDPKIIERLASCPIGSLVRVVGNISNQSREVDDNTEYYTLLDGREFAVLAEKPQIRLSLDVTDCVHSNPMVGAMHKKKGRS